MAHAPDTVAPMSQAAGRRSNDATYATGCLVSRRNTLGVKTAAHPTAPHKPLVSPDLQVLKHR
jgi:hypothetical protein